MLASGGTDVEQGHTVLVKDHAMWIKPSCRQCLSNSSHRVSFLFQDLEQRYGQYTCKHRKSRVLSRNLVVIKANPSHRRIDCCILVSCMKMVANQDSNAYSRSANRLEHIVHRTAMGKSMYSKRQRWLAFRLQTCHSDLYCTAQWISWGYETRLRYEWGCMI